MQVLLGIDAEAAVGAEDQGGDQRLGMLRRAQRQADHRGHPCLLGELAQRLQQGRVRRLGEGGGSAGFVAGERQFGKHQQAHAPCLGDTHQAQVVVEVAWQVGGVGAALGGGDQRHGAVSGMDGTNSPVEPKAAFPGRGD